MRTNYVLIDFENVQPESIEELGREHFRLIVFVGASQTKVPYDLAASLQRLGERGEYIKIAGNGRNALDFHIAYYIGKIAAGDPSAFFHIVSGDVGFDPLLQHLKSNKIFADRVKTIEEIPLLKTAGAKAPAEQLEIIVKKLEQLKASKPRTVKTLSSTISSLFQKKLSDEEVAAHIQTLASSGQLAVVDTKVSYTL